jgi:flagellar hook protein FlgE
MDALSGGLGAFQTLFATQANNIANVNSDGYVPMRANLATTALGGVDVASITSGSGTVDLTSELPGTALTEIGYTALARAMTAQDDALGTLIDALG